MAGLGWWLSGPRRRHRFAHHRAAAAGDGRSPPGARPAGTARTTGRTLANSLPTQARPRRECTCKLPAAIWSRDLNWKMVKRSRRLPALATGSTFTIGTSQDDFTILDHPRTKRNTRLLFDFANAQNFFSTHDLALGITPGTRLTLGFIVDHDDRHQDHSLEVSYQGPDDWSKLYKINATQGSVFSIAENTSTVGFARQCLEPIHRRIQRRRQLLDQIPVGDERP